jgi:glycosyltransferase involved in cell wall biosynthesis
MRILYVVHQFFPEFASGTERVTLQLAQAMQRAGHHAHVLSCAVQAAPADHALLFDGATQGVYAGVPVVLLSFDRLPGNADTALDAIGPYDDELERWMRAQAFDIVHVMHAMRMGAAVAAAQRVGLPVVVSSTDFFLACLRINLIDTAGLPCDGPEEGRACARKCLGPGWDPQRQAQRHQQARSILDYAQARVAPSDFVARQLATAFPGLALQVVPHGVDLLALQQPAPGPTPAPDPAVLQLGFVGSLIPVKGLHVLLAALALCPDLPVSLRVFGSFHGDDQYEDRLRQLVAQDKRVQLLGHGDRGQVAGLLRQLDLLCLPSLVPETYSLIVHEAAALGVPSLVSARGAPQDAIVASGAGDVVADDAPAAWAHALQTWAADAALRARWRQRVGLPPRVEEEAFFCESLYRAAIDQLPTSTST